MTSRLIYVRTSLLYKTNIPLNGWNLVYLVYPSVQGCLGGFHLLTVNAAISMGVQILVPVSAFNSWVHIYEIYVYTHPQK